MAITKEKHFLTFEIPGEPLSKSNNHQTAFSKKTGRQFMYVPAKYKAYASIVREAGEQAMQGREPSRKLIRFDLTYCLQSRRRKDIFNLPKSICDALNGIVYLDDHQIHIGTQDRLLDKENPRVIIHAYEVEDLDWSDERID